MKHVKLFEQFVNEQFEVHYSDGVTKYQNTFSNKAKAEKFMQDLIKRKGMREVAIYNGEKFGGVHGTHQIDRVIAFWGDGSYLDNVSKKDADLAAKKIDESVNEGYVNEAKAPKIESKDWDRMISLQLKGDDGSKVAKAIKDKNKAMARFVAGLKVTNSELDYKIGFGYLGLFSSLGDKAIELGATSEEIKDLFNQTETPQSAIEKITKLEGKKLNNRFVGAVSKAILDTGSDIKYLPHNGYAITRDGKDAMRGNGRKWTIGYKTEVDVKGKKLVFDFDAITDEGGSSTYYIVSQISDKIFKDLMYKVVGIKEFSTKLKEVLSV